ncbi:peptide chain release factor N(5)-glutamine methyltransferase [Candidatus Peregrinibacteria bacterium]|nr:peptide chain release factor N(5)-glutamine methyltransferase [Candidatus Peregrinibacteria bacterium]
MRWDTTHMRIADALKMSGLPRVETEALLASLLKRDRAWIFANPEIAIDSEVAKKFKEWCDRRRHHEPIAYIIGEKEFFGRSFLVDRSVLIPRPATEGLVALALRFLETGQEEIVELDSGIVGIARKTKERCHGELVTPWHRISPFDELRVTSIVDIGTGSGCIAVTIALERPDLNIIATDISAEALKIARKNAERHGVSNRIDFRYGKNLEPLQELDEPFAIVSNPPYIPEGTKLERDVVDYEPHRALFAGPDGMDVLTILFDQAKSHPFCRGIMMECQADQTRSIDRM